MGRKVWVFAGHTNTVQHCQSLVDRNKAFLAAGTVALYPDGNTKILFNFTLEYKAHVNTVPFIPKVVLV